MNRHLPLLSVALVLFAAPLVAQADSAQADDSTEADIVGLRFGWPPGLTAQVTAWAFQLRENDTRADSTESAVQFRMETAPHDSGLLVTFHDFDLLDVDAQPWLPETDRIMRRLDGLLPSYLVSPGGELLEITGLDSLVASAEAALKPVLDSVSAANPEAEAFLRSLVTPDIFVNRAAEMWNAMVEFWLDADLDVGWLYELETEEPSPIMPERMIPFTYEFGIVERVTCTDDAAEAACVSIELVSMPDQDSLTAMLDELTAGLAEAGEGPIYEEMQVENTVLLVTDPETLTPYWLEITQSISGSGREPRSTTAIPFRQLRIRQYDFSYDVER